MVFEEIELKHLIKELEKSDDLVLFSIKTKIEQVMQQSIHKRYTLRTTDWCVENGKKNKGKTKKIKLKKTRCSSELEAHRVFDNL